MNFLKRLVKSEAFHSILASLICIFLGILIGYIVLLIINPNGAWEGIIAILKNFLNSTRSNIQIKNLGNTLAKTAPLLMCSLSVLFCYKVGLFNIGVAGQYMVGGCMSIYAAIAFQLPWWVCILVAIASGALLGAMVGLLKAYCNVNEVISGIMLNWISLYTMNFLLTNDVVKESTSPYTFHIAQKNAAAILPGGGMDILFPKSYATIAIPIAIVLAVAILIILSFTKFGYELKATGYNKNAAKYAGMAEKRNIIITLVIGGALAALGGAFLYLTDYEQWSCSTASVPGMGFNGIAAAFLGGLNPIGTIFSSFFIQNITAGGAYVDKTMYSSQISDLISSLIIYLCGFVFFLKTIMQGFSKRKENKAQTPSAAETKKGGSQS